MTIALLFACPSAPPSASSVYTGSVDTSPDDSDPRDETGLQDRWDGPNGFGWALAEHDGRVWIGNPVEGRVETLDGEEVDEGPESHGWALASDGTDLYIGAPLSDSDLAGGRMAGTDGHIAFTVVGGVFVDGVFEAYDLQPSALAWRGDELLVGHARGATDEVYALCASSGLVARGAPLTGQVVVESDAGAEVFSGSGRFGHALACGEDEVIVGAPEAGAVWSLRPGEEPRLLGEEDSLGTSVLLTDAGAVYAGAPGSTNSSGGSVVRLR